MRLPSLNFLLLLLVFTGVGAALWHGVIEGAFPIFVFVLAGWVVSLCLHEFGHAFVAYRGGDHTVAETGYLDLDPRRYVDPGLSILLPIIWLLLGGIGLPGGAVWIRTGLLRTRGWVSAVSAAGPAANVLFLIGLAILSAFVPHQDSASSGIAGGLAILAYFQATAIILNLLPVPGLDGFGIIRPFLPVDIANKANDIGAGLFLVLFLLLWLTPLGGYLSDAAVRVTLAAGFDFADIRRGYIAMRTFRPHF